METISFLIMIFIFNEKLTTYSVLNYYNTHHIFCLYTVNYLGCSVEDGVTLGMGLRLLGWGYMMLLGWRYAAPGYGIEAT